MGARRNASSARIDSVEPESRRRQHNGPVSYCRRTRPSPASEVGQVRRR